MIEWSDLPDKVATLPIQAKDGFVLSHTTDGGTTYSVSKFGTMDELVAYLGLGISANVVAVGNATGTGIEDSSLKIGDLGTPTDHWEAASNFFDSTNYARYIDNTPTTGGQVWHNSKDAMFFTVDNGQVTMNLTDGNIAMAVGNDAMTVEIGNGITPTGAKLLVKGETDDSGTTNTQLVDSSGADLLKLLNDGAFSLKTGTSINEISTDPDFSGATDNQAKTALAIKTYFESLQPWKAVDFVSGDFSDPSLTTTITGYALAEGEDFTGVRATVSEAFAGPSITSVTMSIGIVGEPEKFMPNFDAAIIDDWYESNFAIMGSPTNIIVTITVIGANLDTLNAGAIALNFKTSQS